MKEKLRDAIESAEYDYRRDANQLATKMRHLGEDLLRMADRIEKTVDSELKMPTGCTGYPYLGFNTLGEVQGAGTRIDNLCGSLDSQGAALVRLWRLEKKLNEKEGI
jgi:hypothetical protein